MVTTSGPSCPRCHLGLQQGQYAQVELLLCPTCQGVLVGPKRLTPLLEEMARDLLPVISGHEPIQLVRDRGFLTGCPSCGANMGNHGYLGSKSVLIDRCTACGSIWLDTWELGVMSLLYTRTEKRLKDLEEGLERVRKDAQQIADSNALASSVGRILLSGFILSNL